MEKFRHCGIALSSAEKILKNIIKIIQENENKNGNKSENDNDNGKMTRVFFPFSSIGINAGIKLAFGGTK